LDSRSRAADLLALVPAAAIPPIFLHRLYQPDVSIGPLDVYGADVAVWAVVAAAVAAGIRFGWAPLAPARTLWLLTGALLALFAASCFWTPLDDTVRHLISAAKIAEYALLAPALVLLLRTRAQLDRFLVAFVAWAVAAAGWGVLQFLGVVSEFEGKRPGQREVSFLGIHDFAAFSGAALVVGLAGIALRERRRLAPVAVVAGSIGVVLAASLFAYAGVVLAAAGALYMGRRAGTITARRVLALSAVLVTVLAGVLALRTYDVTDFLSFLGGRATVTSSEEVQSGTHRALLAYIGIRIWRDHPVLGAGFGRSIDRYEPYLDDAKRRFPDSSPEAFPSPENRWGVQNYWVQLLADVGVVGFVLGLAVFGTALALALRAPPTALATGAIAAGWILVAAGTWHGVGIVAGLPLQALTFLGFGLAATVTTVR
jgi:O-Antigen ligase